MFQQIIANIQTNLIFYRRSRLLVAAAIFIVLMLGMTTLPSLFFMKMLLAGGIKTAGEHSLPTFVQLLKLLVDALYMILPTFNP